MCSFKYKGTPYYVTYGFTIYSESRTLFFGPTLQIVFNKFLSKFSDNPETVCAIIKRVNPDMDHMHGISEVYNHFLLPVQAYYCIDNVMCYLIYLTAHKKVKMAVVTKTGYGYQVHQLRYYERRNKMLEFFKTDSVVTRKDIPKEIYNRLVVEAI